MPKQPERPRDTNQLAKRVVEIATKQAEETERSPPDPAAVKRGDARAAKLPPEQRRAIARKAARTRWDKKG